MYRCPLCLKALLADDTLLRYCHSCDEVTSFEFKASSLSKDVKCSTANCKSNGKIAEGIYISHQECEALNPLWKGDKFEIPADLNGEQITLNFDKIGAQTFIHWENKMLGETSRIGRKAESKRGYNTESKPTSEDYNPEGPASERYEATPTSEVGNTPPPVPGTEEALKNSELKGENVRWMFFPSLLLRATGEKRPDTEKRFGKLVGLAGVPGAGKTVLAFQALTRRGYLQRGSKDTVEIEDFIYSFPNNNEVQPIFELLYIKSLMRENRSFTEPESTVPKSSNVYSIFINPTKKALQKNDSQPEPADSKIPQNESHTKGLLSRLGSRLWAAATRLYYAYQGRQLRKEISKPFWFTLALYDVAGEDDNISDANVERIEDGVDKIALVIDATDLKPRYDGNIARTNARLQRLKGNSKPFCVILTKMDMFIDKPPIRNFSLPNLILKDKRNYYSDQEKIKRFLVLFKERLTKRRGSTPHNLIDLLTSLIALGNENPIFLLENSNLTDSPNAEVTKMPISIGLDSFVCWCLEIGRDEIIESS